MVDNINLNQLYNSQIASKSTNASSQTGSFSGIFSSSVESIGSVDMDTITGLSSDSSSNIQLLLGMLKNGSSGDMLSLLLSMIGVDDGGLINGTTSASSAMQKVTNGLFGTQSFEGYSEAIPTAASVAVNPYVTSTAYNRNAQLYRQVINQFNVETNPRYEVNKKGRGDTYCNIFMWDVTRAMGAEIPHYVDPETMEPRYYPDTQGAREMNANSIYRWLGTKGQEYGWKEVSAETAQQLANAGHPVVTAKQNPGGVGHVQVVCPSLDGGYDPRTGVTVAQAGSTLTNYATMSSLYRNSMPEFKYYAHV